jgi:uncharacterized protein YndB with AHSA1/START domain
MNALITLAGGLALATGILALFGWWTPRNHHATSRLRLVHAPEQVWAVVRDLEGVPRWWPEMRNAEHLPDRVGQDRYRQTLRNNFTMTVCVAESEPGVRLRTVIDAPPGAPFGGAWIYELLTVGTGTELRVTEEGWIGPVIFRAIARLMGYHRTLDGYLSALARRLGEAARPEHISPSSPR